MTDFGEWLRVWAEGEPTLLKGEYADLANLCVVQHEFLAAHWEIAHERCEHGPCKSLRLAHKFQEKYQ